LRIDKYLNAVNLTKRRSVAQDMLKNGVVKINDTVVKASKNVAIGDKITLVFLDREKSYKVLQIPTTKSTPKSKQLEFIEEIS
jgi:ribosomal 50S subunit-recycling heat shock protein